MKKIKRRHEIYILRSMLILATTLFVMAFLFLSCDNGIENKYTEDEFLAEIDAFVTSKMNTSGSGYAIMAVKDGEIAFSKGWGKANIELDIPFTPDTPSDLASLSKQFTAVAILILYEQELLNLDTNLTAYFPEFPSSWSDITIHHLLIHQSGIPNYSDLIENGTAGYDGQTNQSVLDLVLQNDNLDFPPGEQTSYSNTGYLILAMLVEKIANNSYSEFLEETIFEPLEMDSTIVRNESFVYPQNVALNYDENDQLYEYTLYTYGDGGIYSSLHDMYKWDQALYTDEIVSQSTLQLAFTGYTGGDNNYGYGWMVSQHERYPSYRHGGYHFGFLNYIYRVPGRNFTYLMLSNGGVFANDGFGTWTEEVWAKFFDFYL